MAGSTYKRLTRRGLLASGAVSGAGVFTGCIGPHRQLHRARRLLAGDAAAGKARGIGAAVLQLCQFVERLRTALDRASDGCASNATLKQVVGAQFSANLVCSQAAFFVLCN